MGICRHCKSEFADNRPNKIYCNMDCYVADPARRERIIKRNKAEAEKKRVDVSCLNCGHEFREKQSRKSKFCNRRCYREYFDSRFDRNIASSYSIDEFQNYDEFLLQSELPCPIKDCNWHGKNLGSHVNFSHGITARDFKKLCGFNLSTGLVTMETSEKISDRPHLKNMKLPDDLDRSSFERRDYYSKESVEHSKKTAATRLIKLDEIKKDCSVCGKHFTAKPNLCGGSNYKYCSAECRQISQNNKKGQKKTEARCGSCGTEFLAGYEQILRLEKGKPVFCSTRCRQINNSNRALNPHNKGEIMLRK